MRLFIGVIFFIGAPSACSQLALSTECHCMMPLHYVIPESNFIKYKL